MAEGDNEAPNREILIESIEVAVNALDADLKIVVFKKILNYFRVYFTAVTSNINSSTIDFAGALLESIYKLSLDGEKEIIAGILHADHEIKGNLFNAVAVILIEGISVTNAL